MNGQPEEDQAADEDSFFRFKDEDGSMTGQDKPGFFGKEKKEDKGMCKVVKNNA